MIEVNHHELIINKFPAGEYNVRLIPDSSVLYNCVFECMINFSFESSDDIVLLLLVVDAFHELHKNNIDLSLNIPYFPFSRQDRVMNKGEAFSLRSIASVIKSLNFKSINVLDPHSDVLAGLFPPGLLRITTQEEMIKDAFISQESFSSPVLPSVLSNLLDLEREKTYVISPDAGALKKIYKVNNIFSDNPVLIGTKIRNTNTGEITGTEIIGFDKIKDSECNFIIIDDICDGGRTFNELAKFIKEKEINPKKLILYVSHGIFSKGFEEIKDYFNFIIVANIVNKAVLHTTTFERINNHYVI